MGLQGLPLSQGEIMRKREESEAVEYVSPDV